MAAAWFGGHAPAMNSSLKRLALLLITTAILGLVATGCQTSKGFGKDVENSATRSRKN
jgi:predicted small secreted protein